MTRSAPPPPGDGALAAQIAAREAASRADAAMQERRRAEAAARALGLDPARHAEARARIAAATERTGRAVDPAPAPPAPLPSAAAPSTAPSATPTPTPTPTPAPPAPTPATAAPGPWPAPSPTGPGARPPGFTVPRGGPGALAQGALKAAGRRGRVEEPVMQLQPTVVATDIDRVGDQLVVLRDRLELRDRHGTVRRSLPFDDIELVHVHRRHNSAVLEVTTRVATDLVIKGLRPESAESARAAIMDLRPDAPTTTPALDERALVAALLSLHRAGVLDDVELAEKKALVARTVRRAEGR